MESSELLTISFLALGGVVALLPVAIMGKIGPVGILKLLGVMCGLVAGFGLFYSLISDYSLAEILLLKGHPAGWPPRAISVPYIMIIALVVMLPVSLIVSLVKRVRHRPNNSPQPTSALTRRRG